MGIIIAGAEVEANKIVLCREKDRVVVRIDNQAVAGFKDNGESYLWKDGGTEKLEGRWKK